MIGQIRPGELNLSWSNITRILSFRTRRTNRLNQPDRDAPEEAGSWAEIFTGRYGIYTFILNLGMLLFAINQFVVATIMPSVVEDLGGVEYYTWAFSLFAVGAIVGAASAGTMRNAYGARRAYGGAGLLLSVGLVGSALATDMPMVVGWRLVQGIGGGALASQAYGLIATLYPQQLRGRVLTMISIIWGVATLGGPGYGALFAESGLWRGAFWSLAPLTVVFALLVWRYVEAEARRGGLSQLPFWRLTLLALAVVLLSATSVTPSIWVHAVLVVGSFAFAGIAFRRDARAEHKMFPRQITAVTSELGALFGIFFLVSVVMAFVNTYTTFYLQELHGVAPLTAGYLFAIQSFMWTFSALAVATARPTLQTISIFLGLVLLVLASLGVAMTVDSGPVYLIAIFIGLSGAGIGFINNPAIQKIMVAAPEAEKQIAGTSVQAVRNIGISFGAAAAGMVAAAAGLVDGADRATVAFSMEWVFGACLAASALALVLAVPLLLRRGERRQPEV
jgi:MFS family permease